MKKLRNIEKASWIAGILSLLFTIYVYLYPHTQNEETKPPNSNIVYGNSNTVIHGNNNNVVTENPKTQEKIDSISSKTDTLLQHSERQPQITMTEYVIFRGKKKIWKAPNKIYPGSIVELYGFYCYLHISTDSGFNANVMGEGWQKSIEIVIEGNSGVPSNWKISTEASCEGKVVLFSSPRIRSLTRSWDEERIKN